MNDYSPRKLFADWYRHIDMNLKEEVINFRLEAIDVLLEENDKDFWIDVVRLYLSLPLSDPENKEKFISPFKEKDAAFPLVRNQTLLKTLAAITLCIHLDEFQEKNSDLICLTIFINNFFKTKKGAEKIPVLGIASDYLKEKVSEYRNNEAIDFSEFDEDEAKPKGTAVDGAQIKKILECLKTISQNQSLINEESNVLWWIFGEYSKTLNKTFSSLGYKEMVFVAAKELSSLTMMPLGLVAAEAFLHKALVLSNKGNKLEKEVSLFDLLKSMKNEHLHSLLDGLDNISEITPSLNAVKKAIVLADGNFEVLSDEYLSFKKKSYELSFEIYCEYLLLKLY